MESVCAGRPNWVDSLASWLLTCLTVFLPSKQQHLQTNPPTRLRAHKEILMVTPGARWLIFCQGARAGYNEAG